MTTEIFTITRISDFDKYEKPDWRLIDWKSISKEVVDLEEQGEDAFYDTSLKLIEKGIGGFVYTLKVYVSTQKRERNEKKERDETNNRFDWEISESDGQIVLKVIDKKTGREL